MTKLKKALALLLAVSMLATSFVACKADKDEDKDTDKDVDTSTGDDKDKDDDADDAEEPEEFTYPMTYDGEQVSIWTTKYFDLNSTVDQVSDSPWHVKCAEKTGLDLDWTFAPAGTNADTAYNLAISSTQLPTMIGWAPTTDGETLIADGVAIDLSDYIDDWAPNYWETLNSEGFEHHLKSLITDAGQIAGFGGWREEAYGAVYQGTIIRQDLLDEQGLDVPLTIADWDHVMEVMYNEYGLKYGFELSRTTPLFGTGFGTYATTDYLFYLDNDAVKLAQLEPEWQEYMIQMNEWFAKGYLDPDCITIDDATMKAKLMNGDVFAAPSTTSRLTIFFENIEETQNGFVWTGVPYPVVEGEDRACYGHISDVVRPRLMIVTTAASDEQIEASMRWLDYWFTEEGKTFINYGAEGDLYNLDDKGEFVWTDDMFKNETRSLYAQAFGNSISVQYTNLVQSIYDDRAVECNYTWADTDALDYFYPQGVSYTVDEDVKRSELLTGIDTYIEETAISFIRGDLDPSGSDYDKFIQTLKDMNVDELIQIQQDAYDRFNAR